MTQEERTKLEAELGRLNVEIFSINNKFEKEFQVIRQKLATELKKVIDPLNIRAAEIIEKLQNGKATKNK